MQPYLQRFCEYWFKLQYFLALKVVQLADYSTKLRNHYTCTWQIKELPQYGILYSLNRHSEKSVIIPQSNHAYGVY